MRRFSLLLGAGVAAAAAPAAVHVAVGFHRVNFTGTTHVYTVGFSAFVALVAAVGLTAIGARRGDTRTMVVGTAFAVMAGLLALHGFSTPGVWFGSNGVVAITGGATLPAGAIVLVFSVLPLPRVLRNVVPFLLVEAALLAVILALGVSALDLAEPAASGSGAGRSRRARAARRRHARVRARDAARGAHVPAHAARARPRRRRRPRLARDRARARADDELRRSSAGGSATRSSSTASS